MRQRFHCLISYLFYILAFVQFHCQGAAMSEGILEKRKGNFCQIQGFKPSRRSLKAIEEMNQ